MPEEASHVRLRFFAPGPVLEETIWPRIAAAASSSELVVRSTRSGAAQVPGIWR